MMRETVKKIQSADKRITHVHITQSVVAGLYIMLVFWIMHSFDSELAVTSLGASTFIAFSSPAAPSSRPRIMIGGYGLGVLIGFLCNGLAVLLRDVFPFPGYIPACFFAVFLSVLLMTTLHFEHPPSTALAVAVTIDPNPVVMGFAGLCCIVALCVLKEWLKKHLQDL